MAATVVTEFQCQSPSDFDHFGDTVVSGSKVTVLVFATGFNLPAARYVITFICYVISVYDFVVFCYLFGLFLHVDVVLCRSANV